MQDITPWSLGKHCPATLVWACTHCSSWFPLVREVQETCNGAAAPDTSPPACEGEGGAGLFTNRMSWPLRQSAAVGCQNIVYSPTQPRLPVLLLPLMHWFPLTPQVRQACSSFAYNVSRMIPFLACCVSGFPALLLPGQLHPQAGGR